MTTRRVLVTGASGFVGRHTLPALLARGFEVHGVARHPLPSPPPGITQHRCDLLDSAGTAALVARLRPTHLLHLAWMVTPGKFWTAPDNLDWVAASLRLYRAFAAAGGRRLLATGTCVEYDLSHPRLDETATPCRPATLYGTAKHALHQVLAAAAAQDQVSLAWARLFFLYGPHEATARLVPDIALALLHGRPALCGPGTAQRDFMAVQDAAAALAALLDSPHQGPANIATGRCVPLSDIIHGIADHLGRSDLVRLGARPAPSNEPPVMAATTQALDAIGFHPARTLEQGLAETADWWASQPR